MRRARGAGPAAGPLSAARRLVWLGACEPGISSALSRSFLCSPSAPSPAGWRQQLQPGFGTDDGGSSSGGGSGSSRGASGGGSGSSSGRLGDSGGSSPRRPAPHLRAHDTRAVLHGPDTHVPTDIGALHPDRRRVHADHHRPGGRRRRQRLGQLRDGHLQRRRCPRAQRGQSTLTLHTQLPTGHQVLRAGLHACGPLEIGRVSHRGRQRGRPLLHLLHLDHGRRSSAASAGTWELSGDVVFFSNNGATLGLATIRSAAARADQQRLARPRSTWPRSSRPSRARPRAPRCSSSSSAAAPASGTCSASAPGATTSTRSPGPRAGQQTRPAGGDRLVGDGNVASDLHEHSRRAGRARA